MLSLNAMERTNSHTTVGEMPGAASRFTCSISFSLLEELLLGLPLLGCEVLGQVVTIEA